MGRVWRWWTDYWFQPRPTVNLAVCRLLWVGYQLFHLFAFVGAEMADVAILPQELYRPNLVLRILLWAFGGAAEAPLDIIPTVYGLTVAAGVFALLGCLTNLSLGLFTLGNVFLQALRYSYGELHHPEAAMMLGLGLLALGPSGGALSLDAWWKHRRAGGRAAPAASPFAGWPLRTIQWLLVLAYLSAASAKLADAGLDWMNGYTLQYYTLRDALRWDCPVGLWLGQCYPAMWVMGWLSIAFEATFAAAVLVPRLAWLYLPLGVMFHLGIYVTMNAPFFTFMVLYAAFVPWTSWFGRVRAGAVRTHPGQVRG